MTGLPARVPKGELTWRTLAGKNARKEPDDLDVRTGMVSATGTPSSAASTGSGPSGQQRVNTNDEQKIDNQLRSSTRAERAPRSVALEVRMESETGTPSFAASLSSGAVGPFGHGPTGQPSESAGPGDQMQTDLGFTPASRRTAPAEHD